MAFLKRLGYYMAGLAIGIVILTFLLKKKTTETGTEFCYFPNCRVLKELRSKPLSYSPSIQELLTSQDLDTTEVKILLRNGDVNFTESDTKSTPCKDFLVEGTINGKKASLLFKNCENTTILEAIDYSTN
jgi:hypothetical protein